VGFLLQILAMALLSALCVVGLVWAVIAYSI
jgi:hypothetical protein